MSFVNRPLLSLAFLAIAGLIAFFWSWPQYQELTKVEEEVEIQTLAVQNREAYLAKLREIKTNLDQYETQLAQVESALPNEFSLPLFTSKMQSLSAEAGGALGSISTDQASSSGQKSARLKPITISFTFTGSYEDIQEFVDRIHASSRFLQITSLQFSPAEEELGEFEFQVTAQAYSY